MSSMDEWLDVLVRRVALEVLGARQHKGTLVATEYNPKTHAVKGIIVPHGIECGWVPISALHSGAGYGILVGPKVGSAEKLDGDQFDLDYDLGDPNTMVARHKQFSTPDNPPEVQSGEYLLHDQNGNKVFFAQDKSLTVIGQNGSKTTHHPDGRVSVKPGDGKFLYTGGNPDEGGSYDFVVTVSGPSTTHKAKL